MIIRKYELIIVIILFILLFYLYYNSYNILSFDNCYSDNTISHFTNITKKIAFLFLIYDIINQEELWYNFLKNIDKNKYNIYIHYKENDTKLKYFEDYKLKNCINTKWGDKSLVIAQNILLKEALKDPSNQSFIFLSNSCIPLKSFDYIYNNID